MNADLGPLLIVGAGDHGRVVLEAARAAGWHPVGFVDPQAGRADADSERMVEGIAVVGDLDRDLAWHAAAGNADVVVAIGDNRVRAAAYHRCRELGLRIATIVHPRAVVLQGAVLGDGAQVCAGAVVGVSARVGANAVVNTSASVDHDCEIGAHAMIAPGVHLAGRVMVGEGAVIGIGAVVREGCRVGDWALVAAGAAVVEDVPDGLRVAGVPARPMQE